MSPVALQRGVPGVERDGVVVVHVAGVVVVDVKAAVRAPVVELETKVREGSRRRPFPMIIAPAFQFHVYLNVLNVKALV